MKHAKRSCDKLPVGFQLHVCPRLPVYSPPSGQWIHPRGVYKHDEVAGGRGTGPLGMWQSAAAGEPGKATRRSEVNLFRERRLSGTLSVYRTHHNTSLCLVPIHAFIHQARRRVPSASRPD
ncbi:hypothetical protein CgunFtcFv8_012582 [Champsocephalus gunnari]|uniref:Uncharacterized protein n=1 Tax=Champsocephalus gunnari TaxID=52237 RepID=A0AAN8DQU3_CHAGU|nr:hypothetical protein CgunFtcFv8_012582 [Champsocephalus gunnari]